MPSILFLSLMNGAAWGGSEELWYKTALHAAKNGYQVGCAFYDWQKKNDKVKTLQNAGCKTFIIPNKGRSKNNLWEKATYKITRLKAKTFVYQLPLEEYEIVVINLGGFEIYTDTWKNLHGLLHNYALLFHNYDENEIFTRAKMGALNNWIKKAAINFFASEKIIDVLEEKLSLRIKNAEVVINPLSFDTPFQLQEFPSSIDGFVFVMLAALDISRKAQDQLIVALSSLKWKERNWTLFFYGEGHDKRILADLIQHHQLSDRIFLKGQTDSVKEALLHAHLVLHITHRDAMPLSVTEAMAMGRPVIVSEIGDMPKWIKEGENGWIAAAASAEEIDKTLEKAWQQRDNWKEMGKHSFEIFEQVFPPCAEQKFLDQLSKIRRYSSSTSERQ